MLERPFITIRRLARKNNALTKDTVKYVFELSDKFSLWIIGLSLASISLLVSSFDDITKHISPNNLKVVFLFLFISSFCGIIFRLLFIWYYILTDAAFRVVDFILDPDNEHMDTEPILNGNENFNDLIDLVTPFEELPTDIQKIYNASNDITKKKMYDDMIVLYTKHTTWAKQDTDFTMEYLADVYNTHLGISKNKFKKEPSPRTLNFVKYLSIVLYFSFLLSFLFAFGYFLATIQIF